MLTRRGFLGRLAGAFAAALASTELAQLSFPPAPVAVDAASRISIRWIKAWDHDLSSVTRMDVLYGYANFSQFSCRIAQPGSFLAYVEKDLEIQERVAFPHCSNCIRMIGATCRARGCMAESYRSAALDFKPDTFELREA